MKIYDNLKEMSLIQCIITLQTWYYRLNNQWNRLVRDNGAKYDWVRVPAVIFVLATLFLLAYIPTEALAVGTAESHNIWVAYTVGDVSFAHSVLRAISMVMYGDGGVIQGAYRLAALLGIIWLIVRGLFSKDGLNFGSGLFVILFYMCFFVPQSTLHIEDMQTKKFYTMDKIPLGVSASLSVASKIGKYLSDAYESVFIDVSSDNGLCSAGSMECNGYMGTLDLISKARTNLQNSAAYVAINQSLCNSKTEYSSCDIETSLLNYFRDCTIHKVTNPNERFSLKNVKSFSNNADTAYDMKFDSKRHTVNIYLGSGKTGMMTCKDAGTAIEDAFRNAKVKTTIFKLASPLHNMNPHDGGSVADGGTGFDNGTTTGANNTAVLQGMMGEALAGLGGSSADPYEYLKNVIIEPIIADGMRAGFIDQNMVAARISLDTALAQRDLQLAAESSMFATMIRPLSTFLEGFVLALTPIMPFIILISLNGFAICMKYLMVLLWIQLWAPALAICNMYVQSVAKENLEIALSGTDITSLAGISRATPIIQHWLAVGGMMGASVPVLTLFILSGSIYTFNTLATSIKGGDHFDEKAIQPDAMKRAAFINTSVGSYNISSGAGSTEDGTSSAYARITSSEMASISESAAHAEKVAKSNQYLNAVIHGMSNSTSAQHNRAIVRNLAQQWASKDAKSYQEVTSRLQNAFSQEGLTLTDTEAGDLAVMLKLSAKGYGKFEAGVKGEAGTPEFLKFLVGAKIQAYKNAAIGAELGISGEGSAKKSWTDTEQSEFTAKIMDSANKQMSGSKGKAIENALTEGLSSMDQNALTKGFQSNDAHNVSDSFSQMKTAEDAYNRVSTNTSSYDKTKSYGTNELAGQILNYEPEKRDQLLAWMDKNKDFTRGIINSSYGKGKASNTTGIFASLIEYAKFNENDKEAHELLNIMQLDDYLGKGEANKGVNSSNRLGVNPSDINGGPIDNRVLEELGKAKQSVNGDQSKLRNDVNSSKGDESIINEQEKLNNNFKNKKEKVTTVVNYAQAKIPAGYNGAGETFAGDTLLPSSNNPLSEGNIGRVLNPPVGPNLDEILNDPSHSPLSKNPSVPVPLSLEALKQQDQKKALATINSLKDDDLNK